MLAMAFAQCELSQCGVSHSHELSHDVADSRVNVADLYIFDLTVSLELAV